MNSSRMVLLGVNIDHIATVRQLRGTCYPDLLEAARLVELAGGDQITVHLREDRRHIQDQDVRALKKSLKIPLNLEMAATDAMTRFARSVKPDWCCLVPEKRQEVTTEGGLDLKKGKARIKKTVIALKKAGIRVSLFIEPTVEAVKLSHELGADAVELHTGRYCLAAQALGSSGQPGAQLQGPTGLTASKVEVLRKKMGKELERIALAGSLAKKVGLELHAGHGFDYVNVRPVAELESAQGSPLIEEYNIGHAIVARATLVGLERAVREMISAIRAP